MLRIDFYGLKKSRVARRSWWVLIGADDVDVCIKDPGFEVAATITADLSTYVRVYLGHVPLATALRSRQRGGPAAFEQGLTSVQSGPDAKRPVRRRRSRTRRGNHHHHPPLARRLLLHQSKDPK